jgi:hypothetical protein
MKKEKVLIIIIELARNGNLNGKSIELFGVFFTESCWGFSTNKNFDCFDGEKLG